MMAQSKYTKLELVYVQSSYLPDSTGMVAIERVVGKLLSQDDVRPDVSNTIDDPNAVREDSATLSEATPSDVLDESHVLDQCSSRMERFQHYLAKNLLFTQPQFYIP